MNRNRKMYIFWCDHGIITYCSGRYVTILCSDGLEPVKEIIERILKFNKNLKFCYSTEVFRSMGKFFCDNKLTIPLLSFKTVKFKNDSLEDWSLKIEQ